ncbi:MAG: HupU protein [Magnetovibrionaceae bacterium]
MTNRPEGALAPRQAASSLAPQSSFNVVWLQAGSCGGCTLAALGTDDRGLEAVLAPFGIRFVYHPALNTESGPEALERLNHLLDGEIPIDALCIEGSAMTGPNGTGRFQWISGLNRSMASLIRDLAGRARYTVAVGTCASFGGLPVAGVEPGEALGLQYLDKNKTDGLLKSTYRSAAGLPVINIAGCAPHPGWLNETLIALASGTVTEADLDSLGRPRFYADHLAHHGCNRNEFYEFKASAEFLSQKGCMMEHLGCKATQSAGDCNQRTWNGGPACASSGYPCIACTEPGFERSDLPYQETPKVAGIPVGLPLDMPRAWFVALAALSKSATPKRVRANALADHVVVPPAKREAVADSPSKQVKGRS